MNTKNVKKPVLETTTEAQPKSYEAPRITRKRSLERVTLASGAFAPGGQIGGN